MELAGATTIVYVLYAEMVAQSRTLRSPQPKPTFDRHLSSDSRENLPALVQPAIEAEERASDVALVGMPMRHRGQGPCPNGIARFFFFFPPPPSL